MNTSPKSKVVLCYGDSNTWGQNDDKNSSGRYSANVRWTGVLQNLLGSGYSVVEEGLGGRTTNLELSDPARPFRNGLHYFIPCLASHSPLGFVVVMLGTSDLKIRHSRSVVEIVNALEKYVAIAKDAQARAKVLLVSPIHINTAAPMFKKYYHDIYDNSSMEKSKNLVGEIKKLADRTGCLFFDTNKVASAGRDGIHFDEASHRMLGEALYGLIAGS